MRVCTSKKNCRNGPGAHSPLAASASAKMAAMTRNMAQTRCRVRCEDEILRGCDQTRKWAVSSCVVWCCEQPNAETLANEMAEHRGFCSTQQHTQCSANCHKWAKQGSEENVKRSVSLVVCVHTSGDCQDKNSSPTAWPPTCASRPPTRAAHNSGAKLRLLLMSIETDVSGTVSL